MPLLSPLSSTSDSSFPRGYVGDPKATQEVLTCDGWLKTGDMLVMDGDGFLSVVDRKKELIKYKGFQGMSRRISALATLYSRVL